MSRFYPHTPHAEDQRLAHSILWVHVLTRAATTGSIIGGSIFAAREVAARFLSSSTSKPVPNKAFSPPPLPRLLRTAGTSTSVALGVVAAATVARMWGREDIEWRDRSWRLLENAGQLETDDWTYGGAVAALAAAGASKRGRGMVVAAGGVRGIVGVAGLGSVLGTMGYLGWRYGVKGGHFSETVL